MESIPSLCLVRKLCKELQDEGVDYCHWKSTAAIDRSAKGENDLDLLLRRSHAQRFAEILHRLQFKEARAPADDQLPGVLDYYGYDPEADRFVHVHAHYQLVLGHDRTKNYRLPIEDAFLKSSAPVGLFRVPEPEFEFIVFVVRMTLKHSSWEGILLREATLPAAARAELEHLEPRVDWSRIEDILTQHLPYLGADLFRACSESLRPGAPIWARVKAARRLQAELTAHARRSRRSEILLGFMRQALRAVRRRAPRGLPGKRLACGGALVALVGGDGAGKSTAVEKLHAWLAQDFDVIRVHLGKPPWSWTTYAIRSSLKAAWLVGSLLPTRPRGPAGDNFSPSLLARYRPLLWAVCTARDRYFTYAKARRFATNGGLVICDRFSLPEIKLMDAPLVELMTAGQPASRAVQLLARIEKRYHASITTPDILAVLFVHPEIAVQRKTDETPESVRERSQEVWECNWRQTRARVIDASRPREEVLAELKSFIWARL